MEKDEILISRLSREEASKADVAELCYRLRTRNAKLRWLQKQIEELKVKQ